MPMWVWIIIGAAVLLLILGLVYYFMSGTEVDTTALDALTKEHIEEIAENEARIIELEQYRKEQESRMDRIQDRVRALNKDLQKKLHRS